MLWSVYRHRFLTARHLQLLHFAGTGPRPLQVRLQRMWAARLLDRTFLPQEAPNVRDQWTETPIYSLATRGAQVIEEESGRDLSEIPHTPRENRRGFARMRHNLIATDFLVEAEALTTQGDSATIATTREDALARQLWEARQAGPVANAIVPDGAITVTHPALSVPQTILVEIVRAGVKAGNGTIRRRMHRIRAGLRSGFFRDVFGFAWVRAVVFLTPTWKRAENLAVLARGVPGGERLFRFGVHPVASNGKPFSVMSASGAPSELLPIIP